MRQNTLEMREDTGVQLKKNLLNWQSKIHLLASLGIGGGQVLICPLIIKGQDS